MTRRVSFFPNRNNNYTNILSSPISEDSTYNGSLEFVQEDTYDSRCDFFPSIHSNLRNNSTSLQPKYNNSKNNISSNKGLQKSGLSKDSDNLREDYPFSRVYIRNRYDNNIYALEFKPTNVTLIPIYLKHRTFEENVNDKCNQPYCKSTFYNEYNNRSIKFNQLKKTYKIETPVQADKVSVMSNKKPLFPKPLVNNPFVKRYRKISDKECNMKKSIICLRYEDMYFEMYPGIMEFSSSQLIDHENEERRKKLLKELHMTLPIDLKNKGNVIVKYKGDVLKFLFTLSEINYSKLKISVSIGVLATDNLVYIKDFSPITDRKVYLSVPKTVYNYKDPMVNVKRMNRNMRFHNIHPYWKEEQRKNRIREYNQCRKKSVYDDIMELKIGSQICYEAFQYINKAKGGTLSCTTDDRNYEKWVISKQKTDLPKIEEDVEKYESMFADQVPDWDLIIYTK